MDDENEKVMHVSSSDAIATDWENVERGHDGYKIKYVQMERRRTETGEGTENRQLASSKQGYQCPKVRAGPRRAGRETGRRWREIANVDAIDVDIDVDVGVGADVGAGQWSDA